ncbi:GNAT family N-acetyltransferase [Fulvivirga sp. 29W222]|uniref:GNAT family N-acetyltransferase n=1 Tax=Fulvivirga marina TaxID=2494733 RepID=A0A937KEC7_9BACT|nr:GNAT family N-acetyltransferase [Fulvivirga marina]MBL6449597.1 GNAT family N-acetyltransferase [Fulvivirga marina]
MINGKQTYTFQLSDKCLSSEEIRVFEDCLNYYNLDNSIWEVFACLFKSSVENAKPLLLKAFKDGSLFGVTIVIRCKRYGKSLFNNKLLSGLINIINIPFYLWIKFGCCMDMMSNPGFVKDPEKSEEVFRAMLSYFKENNLLTFINDYSENIGLYESAAVLPALPHAIIDCSSMTSIQDYTKSHKNIKRKIRVFKNKNGEYKRIDKQLNKGQLNSLKKCFISTSEKSVFYLPYQKLYLNAALTTSSTELENVHYFIATINGEFIGYQAALATGKYLNALHGAFDRNRKTNYHAYDILFVKMTEFALEKGLKMIDFGAVINSTKEKMINKSKEMSYFIYSKYSMVQKLFRVLLKLTKIQGAEQMKFRQSDEIIAQDNG